jgi:putative colanic acid biosynthesis UDP-glucose lipid carrier transferase
LVNTGYIKKHSRIISIFQQMLDMAIVVISLYIAYFLYYPEASIRLPNNYIALATLGAVALYFFASAAGLYQSWRSYEGLSLSLKVLRTWFSVCLSLVVISWALKTTADFSRIILGSWLLITPTLLISSRLLVRSLLTRARKQGHNSRSIAIAGTGPAANALLSEINHSPWMGYRLAGIYQAPGSENTLETSIDIRGDLSALINDAKMQKFDLVFIALPMSAEKDIAQLVSELSDCSMPVHIIPDLFTFQLLNAKLGSIGNLPLISIYDTPHDGINRITKRLEDVFLSALILLLISPLLLAISLAIKLSSKGPVIFKQKRYGIGGDEITVYKFRSMTTQDNGSTIVQASKNDARITPLGAFLRRTSLDELPQFYNVLQGRMSIVGPRPHAVAHNELYRKDIQGYMLRHLVKPGITGWAQINGWRGETDTLEKMEKRVEFDLFYIRNWSLAFDLKIILLTVFKGFINKNAY